MNLGPYAGFIWASYGITAAVICVLAGWLWFDGRRRQHTLADLEARGVKRRSAQQEPA